MVFDLNTFAHKGCKIAAQKKFNFRWILPYYQDLFGIGATIRIGREMLGLPYAGFLKNLFYFSLSFVSADGSKVGFWWPAAGQEGGGGEGEEGEEGEAGLL